jgi:hypothetical protein
MARQQLVRVSAQESQPERVRALVPVPERAVVPGLVRVPQLLRSNRESIHVRRCSRARLRE